MRGYGDHIKSFEQVAILFNTTHSDQTGSIKDRQHTGRPKSATRVWKHDANICGKSLFYCKEDRHMTLVERLFNPHWMNDLRTQYSRKLNVQAGFCERDIIGLFFIDGNLNVTIYLNLVQNEVIRAIENIFNGNIQNIWFQQDGAGPHFVIAVRHGQIEWPPTSPELSLLDYFLWRYLKKPAALSSRWNDIDKR
ncbi:hypothetical protein P5V15_001055 [Pogonomyrmex californicus]